MAMCTAASEQSLRTTFEGCNRLIEAWTACRRKYRRYQQVCLQETARVSMPRSKAESSSCDSLIPGAGRVNTTG